MSETSDEEFEEALREALQEEAEEAIREAEDPDHPENQL